MIKPSVVRNSPGFRAGLGVYLVTAEPVDVELIMEAVAGGVRTVQLRDKHGSTEDRIRLLRLLQQRTAGSGVTLIVNDDVDAAVAVPGVGVHVGPDDRHPAEVRRLVGEEVCVGWSIHHLEQLQDAAALDASDYVAASPVWPTPTKPDTTAPWGLAGVRELRAALPAELPLVGIGGIGPANAADVITAGADGVAVVSAICAAADPRAAARDLRAIVTAATGRS